MSHVACIIPSSRWRRYRRHFDRARAVADNFRTVATGDPTQVAQRWFDSEGGWTGAYQRLRQAFRDRSLSYREDTDPYARWLDRPAGHGGSDRYGGTFTSTRTRTVPMSFIADRAWGQSGTAFKARGNYTSPYRGPAYRRQTTVARMFGHSRGGLGRTGGYVGFPSILNGELKFHDVQLENESAMPANDGIALAEPGGLGQDSLCLIPQNASSSGRIGRKAIIKSIEGKFGFTSAPYSAQSEFITQNLKVHYLLVLDTQANGAPFSDTAVWEFTPDPLPRSAANQRMPLSMLLFRNLENIQRFKVLRHIVVSARSNDPYTDASTTVGHAEMCNTTSAVKSMYMKCNIPVAYDTGATTPSITNVRSNNLQVFCFFDGQEGALPVDAFPAVSVFANFRLRFTDTGSMRTRTSARKRVKRSGS